MQVSMPVLLIEIAEVILPRIFGCRRQGSAGQLDRCPIPLPRWSS